ncbi:unnamed protein product [Phytophthora lilii]|uniref:Unnamed protein product n=1 Tax=Phytophthora lilii TaxID=2077276 RepID=A0A9W6XCD4_9STRA|nr:unnamed protein product [Phytophthora lilii]
MSLRDASDKEEVFILDLLHLPATIYNATLTKVFLSKKVIKLGQSFYQDLQELAQSYPHASCFTVCKGVVEVNDLSISLAGAHNQLSLQKLVFFYLHRKLAKTQQRSNWARRPLTASQLQYAAADALVLIHLYDELVTRIQKQHAASSNKFRLSDVTHVLDVNLPPAPKCSLCFEIFETSNELKKHRKLCLVDVRTLVICAVCDGKKLVTEEVMEHHEKHCGAEEGADEPVVQVKRKRSLSVESRKGTATSAQTSCSKKRRIDTLYAKTTETSAASDVSSTATTKKQLKKLRKKQRKKDRIRKAKEVAALKAQLAENEALPQKSETPSYRKQEYRKRKMSMESSLLASDAMWSQISSDCSTSSA